MPSFYIQLSPLIVDVLVSASSQAWTIDNGVQTEQYRGGQAQMDSARGTGSVNSCEGSSGVHAPSELKRPRPGPRNPNVRT